MTILLIMTVLTALLVAFALYSLGSEDRALARHEAMHALQSGAHPHLALNSRRPTKGRGATTGISHAAIGD